MSIASVMVFTLVAILLIAIGTFVATRTASFVQAFFGEERASGVKGWSMKIAGIGAVCTGIVFGVASVAGVVDILSGS